MATPPTAEPVPDHDAPIAVDEILADDDSALGHAWSDMTASLNSEVVNFPIENGRRYFAYQRDVAKYIMPNDEPEQDRLDLMHAVFVKALGQKLYLAPLDPAKTHHALDLGTGTGIWALDFSDQFLQCEVTGVDLSPIQPRWVPPNVKFEIDNIEQEWTWPVKFDFVFGRYLMCALKDYSGVIEQAYEHLNTGGWAEFQDLDMNVTSDDGTLAKDSSTNKCVSLTAQACEKIGLEHSPGPKLEQWVRDAGFQNVHHHVVKLPYGIWPKNRVAKEVGLYNLRQLLDGLESYSLRLFCDVLGWSKEEFQILAAGVRNELRSGTVHAYYNLHVVYGQKP